MKEKCVRCGAETPYKINYPVDLRRWYVDGAGQLCSDCWNKLWPTKETVAVEETEIEKHEL